MLTDFARDHAFTIAWFGLMTMKRWPHQPIGRPCYGADPVGLSDGVSCGVHGDGGDAMVSAHALDFRGGLTSGGRGHVPVI